jgi:hypothetical protein
MRGWLTQEQFEGLENQSNAIAKMIKGLIKLIIATNIEVKLNHQPSTYSTIN